MFLSAPSSSWFTNLFSLTNLPFQPTSSPSPHQILCPVLQVCCTDPLTIKILHSTLLPSPFPSLSQSAFLICRYGSWCHSFWVWFRGWVGRICLIKWYFFAIEWVWSIFYLGCPGHQFRHRFFGWVRHGRFIWGWLPVSLFYLFYLRRVEW